MYRRTSILVLTFLGSAGLAFAHGGGLDSQGGHNDRKAGTYHFHRGPLAGQSFSSKAAAGRALTEYYKKNASPKPTGGSSLAPKNPSALLKRATTTKKLNALIALLVKKGLITEAELVVALDR